MTWATAWGGVWRGHVGARRGKASFTMLLSAQKKTGQAESRERRPQPSPLPASAWHSSRSESGASFSPVPTDSEGSL